jgi:hypothetical protein
VAGLQHEAAAPGRRVHRLRVAGARRERLLDERVLAVGQAGDGEVAVRARRRRHYDGVHRRVGERVLPRVRHRNAQPLAHFAQPRRIGVAQTASSASASAQRRTMFGPQ